MTTTMKQLTVAAVLGVSVFVGTLGAGNATPTFAAEPTITAPASVEGKCIRKGVRLSDDGRSLQLDSSCTGPAT